MSLDDRITVFGMTTTKDRRKESKKMYHITRNFYKYECGLKRYFPDKHPVIQYRPEEGGWLYNCVTIEPPENICPKCLYEMGLMKITCAWCDKFLGYKEGQVDDPEHIITHGMCDDCKQVMMYNHEVS